MPGKIFESKLSLTIATMTREESEIKQEIDLNHPGGKRRTMSR